MDWLILVLIVGFGVFAIIRRRNVYNIQPKRIQNFYYSRIALSILIPLLFVTIHAGLRSGPDFDAIGRDYLPSPAIIGVLFAVFSLPLVLTLLSILKIQETGPPDKRSLFGLPVNLLPKNIAELYGFGLFILAGVIAEELIFRQFAFHVLHNTMGFEGGILVLSAALLFSIGHAYQGIRGLISSFVIGTLFGVVYLHTASILYPIGLHFVYNATILVPAYRRIHYRKNDEADESS